MTALVEAHSVIVRVAAIREKITGDMLVFEDLVPNETLCTDGERARGVHDH